MKVAWDIRPGGLDEADHGLIDDLAQMSRTPSRIAQVIKKHPATVYWYMLRNGLVKRNPNRQAVAKPYKRGERWCYPYTPEEDVFIEDLRAQGRTFAEIAELATKYFGKPRSHHSIFVRLTILAADISE